MSQKQIDFAWIKWKKKNPFNNGKNNFKSNFYRNEQEKF